MTMSFLDIYDPESEFYREEEKGVVLQLCQQRPDFGPKQIRNMRRLKLGTRIITTNVQYNAHNTLRVIGAEKNGRLNVQDITHYPPYTRKIYLSDHGVFPYSDGKWNPVNYLSFVPSRMQLKQNTQRRRYRRKNLLIAKNNI